MTGTARETQPDPSETWNEREDRKTQEYLSGLSRYRRLRWKMTDMHRALWRWVIGNVLRRIAAAHFVLEVARYKAQWKGWEGAERSASEFGQLGHLICVPKNGRELPFYWPRYEKPRWEDLEACAAELIGSGRVL